MTPPPDRRDDDDARAGLILVRGQVPEVSAWVRRGVVPVTVAPLRGWTVVLPNGDPRVGPPYDDELTMLAARRVPRRLRPALGFFVIGGRAVVTVQSGARSRVRWVVWEPERGVVEAPGLRQAPPSQLIRAAGGGNRAELVEILQERYVAPTRLLAAVAAVLGLPGAKLLVDPSLVDALVGAIDREPEDTEVAYFEDAVKDAVMLRRELEQA